MKRIIIFSIISFLSIYLAGCATNAAAIDPTAGYQGKSADALIKEAEAEALAGKFSSASDTINALEAIFPYRFRERRILDAIYVYFKSGQEELALAQCDLYHDSFPNGMHAGYVNYMRGIIEFDMGSSTLQRVFKIDPSLTDDAHYINAFLAFSKVVRDEKSPYYNDSVLRMNYLRDIFARHRMLIARYYIQRGAYLAAANRAREVIMHYNGTSSTTAALKVLESSYVHLGLNDQAMIIAEILKEGPENNHSPNGIRRGLRTRI
jgi:outer membrane protein assembly factor BamD